MSYYLEGMNLIEGQSEGKCCGEGCDEKAENECVDKCTWVTYGSGDCRWADCTNKLTDFTVLGFEDNCSSLKEDNCETHIKGNSDGEYFKCNLENSTSGIMKCVDPDMDTDKPVCTGSETVNPSPPSVDPINTNLSERVDKLTEQLSENFTKELMNTVEKINDKTTYKLYDDTVINKRYVAEIKKMSFIDLGDPKNSDELDLLENIIINFLDISNDKLSELFQELGYCNIELNVNILLTLAIFYNKNNGEFSNIRDNKLIKVDRLLNRLGMYLPDFFQKILDAMEMCPGSEDKYIVLQHIYKTMFKYNKTNVNLGIMDGFTNIFRYLKNLRTVEMIVFILAIAFVISKVFDMFRVKVDV